MMLARVYLLGMAGFTLLFGLAYLLVPISMVEPAGFHALGLAIESSFTLATLLVWRKATASATAPRG